MTAGKQLAPIAADVLWDDYYENMHSAYNSMHEAYVESDLTQDDIAELLSVHKSLVSKRLNGRENLTLKSMSHMGTAMGCRLFVAFVPYEMVGMRNYYVPTPRHFKASKVSPSQGGFLIGASIAPSPAGRSKVLEPA